MARKGAENGQRSTVPIQRRAPSSPLSGYLLSDEVDWSLMNPSATRCRENLRLRNLSAPALLLLFQSSRLSPRRTAMAGVIWILEPASSCYQSLVVTAQIVHNSWIKPPHNDQVHGQSFRRVAQRKRNNSHLLGLQRCATISRWSSQVYQRSPPSGTADPVTERRSLIKDCCGGFPDSAGRGGRPSGRTCGLHALVHRDIGRERVI
jgi:hypothetical protein